jgi:hypothetical protein
VWACARCLVLKEIDAAAGASWKPKATSKTLWLSLVDLLPEKLNLQYSSIWFFSWRIQQGLKWLTSDVFDKVALFNADLFVAKEQRCGWKLMIITAFQG